MIYTILYIKSNEVIYTFDASNYTEEKVQQKLKELHHLFPASKGYCIASKSKLQ